jgi:hypothetical protein
VADLVRLLARGRGDHTFAPAGERTLKDLPEPVSVATVSWRTTTVSDGSAVPEVDDGVGGPDLVERVDVPVVPRKVEVSLHQALVPFDRHLLCPLSRDALVGDDADVIELPLPAQPAEGAEDEVG